MPLVSVWALNRAAFGTGHFAKSLVWSLTDLLFSYHANAVMGLSAPATGVLLTCTMIYGGALDLVVAWFLRSMEGRPRATLLTQLVGSVLTAVTLFLLFYPLVASPGVTFAYLLIVAMLFRTAYAVYDVAQNALTSLLPGDTADAAAYVTVRMVLSAVARLCIAAAAFLLVGNMAGVVSNAAFVTLPIAVLVIASAAMLATATPPVQATRPGVARPAMAAGMSRPLVAAIAHAAGLTLISRFILFVDGGIAGSATGTVLLLSFVVGSVIGPIACARLGGIANRERTAAIMVIATLAGAVPLALAPHHPLSVAAAMLYGIGLGGGGALIWIATSAAVRDHAERLGVRTDLMTFAVLTATIKLSIAATAAVLGTLLDGFKAGETSAGAAMIAITLFGAAGFLWALRRAAVPGIIEREYFDNRELNRARAGTGR